MSEEAKNEVLEGTGNDEANDTNEALDAKGDGAESNEEEDVDFKKMLGKANRDRSAANKEAMQAKKELAKLQAKVKEFEDKDKSELELAQAKAAEATAKLEEVKQQAAEAQRQAVVATAGVQEAYRSTVSMMLQSAVGADPDLDAKQYLEDLKSSQPLLFTQKPVAAKTAASGTPAGGSGSKQAELDQVREEMKRHGRKDGHWLALKRKERKLMQS